MRSGHGKAEWGRRLVKGNKASEWALMPVEHHAEKSHVPPVKSVPVRIAA
jgi:hypothetical protein